MNRRKVSELIQRLFDIAVELEKELPGRGFLPAGQQLGNLGEVLIADRFGLQLTPPMTKKIDAYAHDGTRVQLKAVTDKYAGVNVSGHRPDGDIIMIVALIHRDGSFEIIFNGPECLAWDISQAKAKSTGRKFVSKGPLLRLAKEIPEELQIKPCIRNLEGS